MENAKALHEVWRLRHAKNERRGTRVPRRVTQEKRGSAGGVGRFKKYPVTEAMKPKEELEESFKRLVGPSINSEADHMSEVKKKHEEDLRRSLPKDGDVRRSFCFVPKIAPFGDIQNSVTEYVCPR